MKASANAWKQIEEIQENVKEEEQNIYLHEIERRRLSSIVVIPIHVQNLHTLIQENNYSFICKLSLLCVVHLNNYKF